MDSDEERSYFRAMLVITLVLGVLAAVVAVLVAIFPGDDDEPAPTSSGTTTSPRPTPSGTGTLPAEVEGRSPVPEWMTLPAAPDPCPRRRPR